jgi:hypothetical protein
MGLQSMGTFGSLVPFDGCAVYFQIDQSIDVWKLQLWDNAWRLGPLRQLGFMGLWVLGGLSEPLLFGHFNLVVPFIGRCKLVVRSEGVFCVLVVTRWQVVTNGGTQLVLNFSFHGNATSIFDQSLTVVLSFKHCLIRDLSTQLQRLHIERLSTILSVG